MFVLGPTHELNLQKSFLCQNEDKDFVPGAQDFGAGGPDGRLPGAAGEEAGAGRGERGGGAEDEHGGAAEGQAEGDHAARRGAVPQRGEADLDAGVGQQQREV